MTYGVEDSYKCSTVGCNTFVKPPHTKCGTCNGTSMEALGKAFDAMFTKKEQNDNTRSDGSS